MGARTPYTRGTEWVPWTPIVSQNPYPPLLIVPQHTPLCPSKASAALGKWLWLTRLQLPSLTPRAAKSALISVGHSTWELPFSWFPSAGFSGRYLSGNSSFLIPAWPEEGILPGPRKRYGKHEVSQGLLKTGKCPHEKMLFRRPQWETGTMTEELETPATFQVKLMVTTNCLLEKGGDF